MPSPAAISGPGAASHGSGAGMKRKRHADPKTIGNKQKRSQVVAKIKAEKKADKRKRRQDRKLIEEQLGSAAPPKAVPHTIDNTRELDETVVLPGDEEVLGDEADDEFSAYFAGKKEPKVMITTKPGPSGKIFRMIAEIMAVIPNSFYYRRGKYRLKNICEWAANKGFTHLVILNEKSKITNGMIVCHLPIGPSVCFRMSSSLLSSEISSHGNMTTHLPELFLSGFSTRLGRRVGRLLASMFPKRAEFDGRRVCTFHNQRDFIFFRQHRYVFEEADATERDAALGKAKAAGSKKVVARLQELGPRFTLKVKWMLAGTFDTKAGEYEWFHKRHEMETSRRRFLL